MHKYLKQFWVNQSGETAIQTSLIFSLTIIVGVVVGVPMLSSASKEYAYHKQYGVDPVQTSSTAKSKPVVKRYTVRKTVMDEQK